MYLIILSFTISIIYSIRQKEMAQRLERKSKFFESKCRLFYIPVEIKILSRAPESISGYKFA